MELETPVYCGACHCGSIGFLYRTGLPPSAWTVRACQCRFCRAHSALTTSDPAGTIEFHEHRAGTLQRYRFGLRVTDFLICRGCGVYIGAEIETGTAHFGIININALHPIPGVLASPTAREYGSESAAEREARRKVSWSPVIAAGV